MTSRTGDILKVRAHTEAHKKAVLASLLAYWLEVPDLRLGQLLTAATNHLHNDRLFHVEDEEMVRFVAGFVEGNAR